MLQFKNVLCPIDFSETSARALRYATEFARWYNAQLEVLHVVTTFQGHRPPAELGSAGGAWPLRDELIAEIERSISIAGGADLTARAVAQEGRPHEMIACRAGALPADVLVMGTHGRSGFNRLLLGSVTEKVLRQVTCPVLTVPSGSPEREQGPVVFKNILCAMDYSASALKGLQYALELGRQANGSVTVLYALEYTDPDEVLEPSAFDPCHETFVGSRQRRQQLIAIARDRLHTQLAQEPTTWCEIVAHVAIDRAYKAILHHADEIGADLIVMGAQGSAGLELMLYGSNTQQVLRSATCPVLTAKA